MTYEDMAAASGDDAADDGEAADDIDNVDGWAAPASCKYLSKTIRWHETNAKIGAAIRTLMIVVRGEGRQTAKSCGG